MQPNIFSYLRINLYLLVLILSVGMFGYMVIEGAAPFDALYMTVITISTVGFAEVFPLDIAGRWFTMALIMSGAGFFAYTFATIAGIITGGAFFKRLQKRRMETEIQKLYGHTIVVGLGEVGREVVKELAKKNKPFVVVSHSEDFVNLDDLPRFLFLEGSANDELLEQAGIMRAKMLVVTTKSDTTNIYVTLTAHALNPKLKIVVRVSRTEDSNLVMRAGAHRTIVVPRITSEAIVKALTN